MNQSMKILTGSSNRPLAEEIAKYLFISLAEVELKKFKDGEISVRIGENIREVDLFIVQSTCNPANDHLMELLLLIDAAFRASAAIARKTSTLGTSPTRADNPVNRPPFLGLTSIRPLFSANFPTSPHS